MGLFRRLFGAKKDKKKSSKPSFSNNNPSSHSTGFSIHYDSANLDANKHAIAVAAATAAVAEAALAAAQAAAEVVRLTNAGGGGSAAGGGRSAASAQQLSLSHRRWVENVSAIKIQSAFRGYLAKRALRALKALVKLQALVRGHIVRKQTADMLRRMQTMVRLQARARASRTHMSESWHSTTKSFHSCALLTIDDPASFLISHAFIICEGPHTNLSKCKLPLRRSTVPSNPLKDQSLRACSTKFDGSSILKRCGSNANFRDIFDQERAKLGPNWLDRWMEESLLRNQHAEDEKADKILEVDTWKPHVNSQQNNRTFQQYAMPDDNYQSLMTHDSPSKLSMKAPSQLLSVSSGEALPYNSLKLPQRKDEVIFMTAEESPHVQSASSRPGSSGRRGPFTPTRSECSWGYFNGYSGYPSYMANTESSQAKVRSQSAPRQRQEFEKYGLGNRSVQGYYDSDTLSERGFAQHTAYKNRPYQASGSLKRVGSSTNLR